MARVECHIVIWPQHVNYYLSPFLAGADASMVRAWDFSGAEEVQQRLDALKQQKEQQRAERRERGRYAGRRLQPRFPPQLDSSEEEDADGDTDMIHSPARAEHSDAADSSHCPQESCSRACVNAAGGSQIASTGMNIPSSSRTSWTCDSAAESGRGMSRSLPARLGPQQAGSGSAAAARQIRPLPPPLVRASGCCAEAEAARINRMTSWDIQRPRRVNGEGAKAAA